MRIETRLTPEAETLYSLHKAVANTATINLARLLQQLAFDHSTDPKRFYGEFEPAPLYLHQAMELFTYPEKRRDLINAITSL